MALLLGIQTTAGMMVNKEIVYEEFLNKYVFLTVANKADSRPIDQKFTKPTFKQGTKYHH